MDTQANHIFGANDIWPRISRALATMDPAARTSKTGFPAILRAALIAISLALPMTMLAPPAMAGSKVEEAIKVAKDAVKEAERVAAELARKAEKAAEKAAETGTKAAKKVADKAAKAAKAAAKQASKAAAAATKIGKKLKSGDIISEPIAVLLGVVPPESKELGAYNELWWPLRPFVAE